MSTVLLVNDSRDHDNWGSQACADTLLHLLEMMNDGLTIQSIPSSWTSRRYRINPSALGGGIYWKSHRFFDRFSRPFSFLPRVADEFETVAAEWLEGRGGPGADGFMAQLQNVDAVVFNAEGSTYRNNYTAIKGLFLLWFAKTQFQIPSFFLNGSVTLTRVDPILPAMVRRTFEVLDGVAVREPCSERNVHDFFPGLAVDMIPDSVFSLGPETLEESDHRFKEDLGPMFDQPYFCFSLSMLPMDFLRDPSRSSLVEVIRELKRIVPGAVLMAKDRSDQYLRDVGRATDSIFFGPDRSYRDLMALLNGASFLLSGRYHHLIMAAIVGCPTIALTTTSHKIEGVCELLEGQAGAPFDATDLRSNRAAILETARRSIEEGETRRQCLRATAARLKAATPRMGAMVQPALGLDRRSRDLTPAAGGDSFR